MKRFHLWPGMVFGLIGMNVCVVGATVYFAHADRSMAIEPDYYRKALGWNEQNRRDARSRDLGWKAGLETGAMAGERTPIAVTLTSRDGAAVSGATVRAIAFHNLRSGERQEINLAEVGAGRYEGVVNAGRSGLWQVQVSARRGSDLFTATLEQEINATTAHRP